MAQQVRHIVSLSGGKDSTALAIYLRDRIADLEYVFCDTEKELPETYEYLDKVEAYLGQPIVRLKHDGRDFDHHLGLRHGFLPSARNRWCTQYLKLIPFERYVGTDRVLNYVGIRADEDRKGYISHMPNITPLYPFVEAGIVKADVIQILESSGLGLPDYYKWRSRSGCYFCFFQQKIEWVGLLENHPDLFKKARGYERYAADEAQPYTWSQGESLEQLTAPDRVARIKDEHRQRVETQQARKPNRRLMDIVGEVIDEDTVERACLICDL
jgi:hypothetical protein